MDQPWQIDLLGGLRACGNDRTVTRFRTHKTGLLLAYLAFHLKRTHSREELAEMLWPESEPAAGRLNLRVELASLRRLLEPPGVPQGGILQASHAVVQLNPRAVCTDVSALEAEIREADRAGESARRIQLLRRAVERYRGELLPGYCEEWILPERRRLADLHLTALLDLSRLLEQIGDREGAIEAAHQAVAADPLSEEARFDLIRLYASNSRPADALCQYRELERNLRDSLDQQPSARIRQFAASLASDADFRHSLSRRQTAPATVITDPPSRGNGQTENPSTAGSSGTQAARLPLTFTRFFDREAELACLERLLMDRAASVARLVTLTGPGGCGKTRLAIEIARRVCAAYNAIWFVSLADLADPTLIADTLADGLRLPRSPEVDPTEQVAAALGFQHSLLILDNLEHLLDAGRDLVWQLLQRGPSLVCLVTSRQRLELEGEREIPVPPLEVPRRTAHGSWLTAHSSRVMAHGSDKDCLNREPSTVSREPELLLQYPSVALFVDRAQAVRPDFQVTPRNAAAVAALCARLEGIPLAVELAAAWAQTLTPAQMVAHLDGGSGLLVSRRKDTAPRHQSLHAAIDWSFRLLDPSLQQFLARLCVFRGGWDLEAAQSVCEAGGAEGAFWGPGPGDAMIRLAALRDRSLVVAEERGEAMRYRLLETVREYTRERLTESEWQELAQRHAAYFLRLAEEAEGHLQGAQQKAWAERLKADHSNLQAALEHSERTEAGLRLAAALSRFWQQQWQLREGSEWLDRAIAAHPDASPALRAKALFAAAALAYQRGDRTQAEALCAEGLSLCDLLPDPASVAEVIRPLVTPYSLHMVYSAPKGEPMVLEVLRRGRHDPRGQAFLLACQGRQATARGEYGEAVALHERSVAIYRELGDRQGVAVLLAHRASVAVYEGDYEAACRYWEESLALSHEMDDPTGIAFATGNLGYGAYLQGDYRRAEELVGGPLALAQSRQSGSPASLASHLWLLGTIACCRGQYDRATALLEESLEIRRTTGAAWAIADTLSALGVVAHSCGDYARARVLQREALELRLTGTDKLDIAYAQHRLGLVALAEGHYEEAERLLQESLDLSRDIRSVAGTAQSLRGLGVLACRLGNLAAAEEHLQENLALHVRLKNGKSAAEALEALAELRARQERAEEAVALYGAADSIREAMDVPLPPCDRPRYTRELAALRAVLGPQRFAVLWEQARGCCIDELVMRALDDQGQRSNRSNRIAVPFGNAPG